MNWSQRVADILKIELFRIGDQPISFWDLLAVALALAVTLLIARWVRLILARYFLRHLPVEAGAQFAVARLTQYLLWVVGVLIALRLLNINLTALAVIAGALGVGIGFGLQGIVANFVSGLVLLFERPIKVKDRITIENIEGNVQAINFRSTTVLTNDNISVIVPNSEFLNNRVINWSYGDQLVRIKIPVGVAYGSDLELVTQTLLAAAVDEQAVLKDPKPIVRFVEFGDSSLNFELLVWIDQPPEHKNIRSRLNYAIDAGFRRKGITIPFPQRDLHVKSAPGLKEISPSPSSIERN